MNKRFSILILISLLLILLSGCSDLALQEKTVINDTNSVTQPPSLINTSPSPKYPEPKYSAGDVICKMSNGGFAQYDGEPQSCAIIIAYDSGTDKYRISQIHIDDHDNIVREINETTHDRLEVERLYPVILETWSWYFKG